MTKEQIKFFIDNYETIFGEIGKRLDNLEIEIETGDNVLEKNIRNFYDECYKHCFDIFDEYNLDYNAFKTIYLIYEGDKTFREQILGTDEANKLLRDVIDIYGDKAYDILGCNYSMFKMSDIEGILLGENNQKYQEFYKKLLNQKCQEAYDLEQLSDILLSTKPEYLSQELIGIFLSSSDKKISDSQIKDFIETAPNTITNGNIVKTLVERLDNIQDASILEQIPAELFDEDFSKSLLKKSDYAFRKVFDIIPEKEKTRDMWEYVVSRSGDFVTILPEQKIDKNMTDEEYSNWCNGLVVTVFRNNPENIYRIFSNLRNSQKNIEVCTEGARLLQGDSYDIKSFLTQIPETMRSRQIYEILLEKSEYMIKEIPDKPFEEGLSQEEYDAWVDDIIAKKISEMKNVDNLLYDPISIIPKEKMTEKVWNAIIDRFMDNYEAKSKFGLSSVPMQNITFEMCKRAWKDISWLELENIPSIDRRTDSIPSDKLREEYEEWIGKFSEEEKQEYRAWYEGIVIDVIKENSNRLFIDNFNNKSIYGGIKIPPEAITINMINAYLQKIGPTGLEDIPVPNEFTKYNKQYEDVVLYAVSMLQEKKYTLDENYLETELDILDKIPKEYITDKVVMEAIKKHPKYLNYADLESENFVKLLNTGYKNKLRSMGRTELTDQEIELIRKYAKNNSSLFSTLNLNILNPEIINSIGENSLERITRYPNVQYYITELAHDKDALVTFGFALKYLKQDSLFIEPLIEQLSKAIGGAKFYYSGYETKMEEIDNRQFLKIVSGRIQNDAIPLTEEEKTVISYLALNPQEASKIKNYDEILNFVANKNAELDEIINSQNSSLIDVKNAYLHRIVGMDYDSVIELIKKYGNDSEQLLAKYEGKELATYKEKAEREALEIIIKLKSLVEEKDLDKIKQAYSETVKKEDTIKSFERFKQPVILDSDLRRAYGRDYAQTLIQHNEENNTELVKQTEDGREYVVRKLNGPFNRMISVMNAYRKSDPEAEGDMYDRWNTSAMSENHALCYSFINEENPGTALTDGKTGMIISISNFDAESVIAAAPYDLCSDSRMNTTETYRQQKFYTADNLCDQMRGLYSEVDIEIQDVSEDVTVYKKIQPTSIICFEEIDEDSINASIELSKKLGRTIPIELIDRRELAKQTREEIDNLLEQFKAGEELQPELVEQIITKFNNVRNAHMRSSLANEILGENKIKENLEAPFNKVHLNEILLECIERTKQKIEEGQTQDGLNTIEQIKQFIKTEREKSALLSTMYEKQEMAGIDFNINYYIDEIQRTYGKQEVSLESSNESLELLQANCNLESPTFEILYKDSISMPEQLSFSELHDNIDILQIQNIAQEIHQKGYYSENKSYSEEHVVRVAMFANAIANLEGQDSKTKQLLGEAAKYYSCGRRLDITEEPYQQYSAKIVGKELEGTYSQTDIGIIQAAIEVQNLKYSGTIPEDIEKERKGKIAELCGKYNLDISTEKLVDTIATCLEDAVVLDKTRFIEKSQYNAPGEIFHFDYLKTDGAKKLVKSSYCMQDELSKEHLEYMSKVAHIDYESEKDTIMREFFTKIEGFDEHKIYSDNIIESPMAQEEWFRYKYREIDDPVKIGRDMAKTKEEETKEPAKFPEYTEQEIGKATINIATESKDKAKDRIIEEQRKTKQQEQNI